MTSPEAELVAARLARMKALIAELEVACAASVGQQQKFAALKRELDEARETLKVFQTHDRSSSDPSAV